jgi:hypothetical protein
MPYTEPTGAVYRGTFASGTIFAVERDEPANEPATTARATMSAAEKSAKAARKTALVDETECSLSKKSWKAHFVRRWTLAY